MSIKWTRLGNALCAHPHCENRALQRYSVNGILTPVCKTHLSRVSRGHPLVKPEDLETETSWWCRLGEHYDASENFQPRSGKPAAKSLRAYECKSCARSEWLDAYYLGKYGITIAQYEQLLEAQNGVCPGCLTSPSGPRERDNRLFVDHDHATGEVRGLLCSPCNISIGGLCDDPNRLRRLADYLEHPTTEGL